MTRTPGELPEPEEALLGIERQTPEQEEEARKVAAEQARLLELLLLDLMNRPLFREWLMGKLTAFGTFTNAFGHSANGSPDPMGTQFALGMKAAGWALWEEVDNLSPELASLMRREAMKPRVT